MPRKPDPNKERWEWPGLLGYMSTVKNDRCEAYAYHFWKGYRESSGLPWDEQWKGIAQKKHRVWIRQKYLEDQGLVETTPATTPVKGAPSSFLLAVREVLRAIGHRVPKNSRRKLEQALSAHFPHDVPLRYDAIHDQLVSSLETAGYMVGKKRVRYGESTLRKHLSEINRVLEHCVQRGWLDRNPIALIGIPKEPAKEEVLVWSREEIRMICAWLRTKSESPHRAWIALFVEWMSWTAMRPGEVRNMELEHFGKGELVIPRTKTGKARSIPLVDPARLRKKHPQRAAWQDRLHEIRDELVRLYEEERPTLIGAHHTRQWDDGRIWPWKNLDKVNKQFELARAALKLVDERRLYDLRATTEDFWVWELGFGLKTICALAGHSPAVYLKYYERRYGAEDRERMITDDFIK